MKTKNPKIVECALSRSLFNYVLDTDTTHLFQVSFIIHRFVNEGEPAPGLPMYDLPPDTRATLHPEIDCGDDGMYQNCYTYVLSFESLNHAQVSGYIELLEKAAIVHEEILTGSGK